MFGMNNSELKNSLLFTRITENASDSCKNSIDSFPNTFLSAEPFNALNVILIIILLAYIFWSIAIICEDYVVLAVVAICDKANVPYDIGGAVFLAAATSAPEFFMATIGIFLTKSDLGISTVLGSAVINILVVTGLCGVFAKIPLELGWWTVTRENLWYILSITMIYLILQDEIVTLMEAVSMIVIFFINILTLFLDRPIRACLKIKTFDEEQLPEEEEEAPVNCSQHICAYPKNASCIVKFLWILKRPIDVLFALTIPKAYAFSTESLIVCVFWIGVQCYLAAWFISVLGYHFHIPDGIMGVTFISLGVSVPEAVSSFIVAQKGHGAMAVSNAIGSNTLDNMLGLGVPWTLYILINGHNLVLQESAMSFITLSLLITTLIMQFTLIATRYRLGKTFGVVCILTYIIFVMICVGIMIRMCYK